MNDPVTIRLGGFNFAQGTVTPLGELELPEPLVQRLAHLGVSEVAKLEGSLVPLMIATAKRALQQANIASENVDRIVWATSDFTQEANRDDLAQVALALGLERAIPLGVSQGYCANFTLLCETAAGLIETGRARTVLSLVGDKYSSDPARLLAGNSGLGSDGVGAFVLTREAVGDFNLGSVAHTYAPLLHCFREPSKLREYVEGYCEGFSRATRDALRQANCSAGDCAHLVVPNFTDVVVKNLVELSGMSAHSRIKNEALVAHCNAVDQVALLEALARRSRAGERSLVTAAGEYIWGAAVIERRQD